MKYRARYLITSPANYNFTKYKKLTLIHKYYSIDSTKHPILY